MVKKYYPANYGRVVGEKIFVPDDMPFYKRKRQKPKITKRRRDRIASLKEVAKHEKRKKFRALAHRFLEWRQYRCTTDS